MLIDTHSHLHFKSYDADREAVHMRMAEFGVKTITIGTALNTSRSAVAYADVHDDTWAAVGYHPDHVTSTFEDEDEVGALDEPYNVQELEQIAASSPRVIAIGETGLDYHHIEGDLETAKTKQHKVFLDHINLAAKLDKGLVVHMRDAGEDMLAMLQGVRRNHVNLRIVMHAFTGTWREATNLLDLGCYLGIGGIVTFKPRKTTLPEDTLESVVKKMPLERLLLETDAPWLAPVPVRGGRNEPTFVRHIAEHVAQVRGVDYEKICQKTTENANQAFATSF